MVKVLCDVAAARELHLWVAPFRRVWLATRDIFRNGLSGKVVNWYWLTGPGIHKDTTIVTVDGITVTGVLGEVGGIPIGIGFCTRSVAEFTSSFRVMCRHQICLLSVGIFNDVDFAILRPFSVDPIGRICLEGAPAVDICVSYYAWKIIYKLAYYTSSSSNNGINSQCRPHPANRCRCMLYICDYQRSCIVSLFCWHTQTLSRATFRSGIHSHVNSIILDLEQALVGHILHSAVCWIGLNICVQMVRHGASKSLVLTFQLGCNRLKIILF